MAGTIVANTVEHRARGLVGLNATVVTDASGDATSTFVGVGFGRLVGVEYDGGLDASASFTITDVKTGATVAGPYVTGTEGTAARFRPTGNIVTVAGATIAADATAPNVNRDIYVAGKLAVVVSAGGNVETGKFKLIVDETPLRGN
jgi:hypothetical protein